MWEDTRFQVDARCHVLGWVVGCWVTRAPSSNLEPLHSMGFSSSWALSSDALTRQADVPQDLTAHVSFPFSHTGKPNILSTHQGVFAKLSTPIILPVALCIFSFTKALVLKPNTTIASGNVTPLKRGHWKVRVTHGWLNDLLQVYVLVAWHVFPRV